jgi:DNA-binding NarL/FixJ family response regulator
VAPWSNALFSFKPSVPASDTSALSDCPRYASSSGLYTQALLSLACVTLAIAEALDNSYDVADALNTAAPRHTPPVDAAAPELRIVRGSLTLRELDVARLVARGMTNRQIAAELFIAISTAERHVANILRKLDFGCRAQLAAWATSSFL